jgi:carboxypeptidase D
VLSASVAEFYVKGTKIPLVDFDVGDSWAGLLPISSHANETRKVCPCAYTLCTKSMLIPASFSFGIFLRLRMVAKTTLYFGEHPPITVRVGANTDRQPIARTNGGPGCSSLEGLLQENGVWRTFCTLSRILVLNHAHIAY